MAFAQRGTGVRPITHPGTELTTRGSMLVRMMLAGA
jgi:hypothetical protein